MTSHVSIEVSVPIEHDETLSAEALVGEGFAMVGRVLEAVRLEARTAGLTREDFTGQVDPEGIRAALAVVHYGTSA